MALSLHTTKIYKVEYGRNAINGWDEVEKFLQFLRSKMGTEIDDGIFINEEETEVEPILNVAHKLMFVKITNAIFKFAAKFGLLTNEVVRDGFDLKVVSELGYCEFGKDLAIAIIPGELAPEIAFGGAMTAEDPLNWTGEAWDYPTFESKAEGRKLRVFGLMDDQIGYIITDNHWHSIFTENEEIVSSGSETGSFVTEQYFELVDSLK